MRSRRTVEEWRRVVFSSATISDAVRVYLLRLADHMDAERKVSVPRAQLARELKRHEQRIAERSAAATAAGLLTVVSPGYKGHTAEYQGLFPDPAPNAKGTDLQYAKNLPQRYAITPDCVPDGEYTSSKRPAGVSPRGGVPNERRSEEEAPPKTGAQVRADVGSLRAGRQERTA